ncbi:MAG: sulfatase, partial [Planctomycetota bacterium]
MVASRDWVRVGVLVALSVLTVSSRGVICHAAEHPNVVLFLVDDLGWADLGCYGSRFHETPRIDALAAESVQFRQGYAACPVCSPTRASIMTGRHPVRVNITDWIPGMSADRVKDGRYQHVHDLDALPLGEVTLAETLRDEANYQTYFLGKWHLGGDGFLPTDQGFDVNVGGHDKGSPPGGYHGPWKNPYLEARYQDEYLTTRLTDEAIDLMGHAEDDRPFFLMLSYYNVHTPVQADRRTMGHYETKATESFPDEATPIEERYGVSRSRQDNPAYASMVTAVDTSVGRILDALKQLQLDDDTLIVFFSDNGGLCTLQRQRVGSTCNLPLRSGKGWLYEGGVREPLLIRFPKTDAHADQPSRFNGSQVNTIACSTDLFPTILDAAGLPLQPQLHADGESLVPYLGEDTAGTDRTLYWHYPHYHGSGWRPGASVRDGDWKLIEFYETEHLELYHLATDPGESTDLADQNPVKREELHAKLRGWQKKLKAKMPAPRQSIDQQAQSSVHASPSLKSRADMSTSELPIEISVQEVKQLQQAGDAFLLLDVR